MFEWLPRFVRRFFHSENANVIIIFALSLFPIIPYRQVTTAPLLMRIEFAPLPL